MKVTPITPDLGAEISDIDLSQSLSPDLFQALQTAFNRHHVLVFRDQALTRDQHKDFARQFGPIHIHPS
ncbi:MAG: TauD/TfdA dioxygenase family protein, partial [Pseudomonadales bacterium]